MQEDIALNVAICFTGSFLIRKSKKFKDQLAINEKQLLRSKISSGRVNTQW
jgi:hypothetical protein